MHKGLVWVCIVTAGLLAGCGGGGGGGQQTPTSANAGSSLTVNTGSTITGVTVAPSNSASTPCGAGVTTSAGQFIVSTAQCGNQPLTITTNNGEVNNYVPGQPTTVVVNTTTTSQIKAYAGNWTASYNSPSSQPSGDSGSCSNITISPTGLITFSSCSSAHSGQFTLTGGLDSNGNFQGTATTGAVYKGVFSVTASSGGNWTNSATGGSGSWTASKAP